MMKVVQLEVGACRAILGKILANRGSRSAVSISASIIAVSSNHASNSCRPLMSVSWSCLSEKLKPNFTPVPNVIFDEIMRGFSDGEFKALMAICRFTYGWGKKSDRISLKQLSEITGIGDRSNVHRAIKRLRSLLLSPLEIHQKASLANIE